MAAIRQKVTVSNKRPPQQSSGTLTNMSPWDPSKQSSNMSNMRSFDPSKQDFRQYNRQDNRQFTDTRVQTSTCRAGDLGLSKV